MKKIFSAALALVCIWFATPAHATLPSGYTQLEYIESTGKQYIDTGIEVNASKLTSGMRMELDIQFLSTNRQNGGNGVTTGPYFWIGYYHPGKLYCGLGSLYPAITVSQNIFSRHSYVLDSALKNFYIDDVLVESYDISAYNGTGKTKITLFSIGTSFYVKQKLYKASIYQANNLVGNFIPAKRNSDGAIGLYDTVSGEFFENKGEGEFVAGPVAEIKIATTKYNESAFSPLNTALQNAISVVDTVVSNTITQAGRIATLQAQKQTRPNDIADDNEKCPAGKKCLLVEDATGVPHWYEIVEQYSRLPDGYTELEYIESTGTQYIDTGWKVTQPNIAYDVRYQITDSSNQRIAGCQAPGYSDGATLLGNGWIFSNKNNTSVFSADTNVHSAQFVCSNNECTYTRDAETMSATLGTFVQNDVNFALFGILMGERPSSYAQVKIYHFKIYDNGVLVRDFVPAKRGDVVGMYDTVSGAFFENKGTGEFIAGDPVVE